MKKHKCFKQIDLNENFFVFSSKLLFVHLEITSTLKKLSIHLTIT